MSLLGNNVSHDGWVESLCGCQVLKTRGIRSTCLHIRIKFRVDSNGDACHDINEGGVRDGKCVVGSSCLGNASPTIGAEMHGSVRHGDAGAYLGERILKVARVDGNAVPPDSSIVVGETNRHGSFIFDEFRIKSWNRNADDAYFWSNAWGELQLSLLLVAALFSAPKRVAMACDGEGGECDYGDEEE